jgi:hypothetical protein
MIKAQRIRSIQEKGTQKIKDGVYGEFMGIINYAVMALIQLEIGISTDGKDQAENLIYQYEKHVAAVKKLMQDKNHDYNEAWREMRISSITDLILVKLLRIKQIEDNSGKTLISEGVDANFADILNYAVFSIIKMDEESEIIKNS